MQISQLKYRTDCYVPCRDLRKDNFMLKLEMTPHFLAGITFICHKNLTYTSLINLYLFRLSAWPIKLNADFAPNLDPK